MINLNNNFVSNIILIKNNIRYFSTSTINNNIYLKEFNDINPKFINDSNIFFEKALELKLFNKNYTKGFYGYNHIVKFGNCGEIINSGNLGSKIKEFLNEIPENTTYTILPTLSLNFQVVSIIV